MNEENFEVVREFIKKELPNGLFCVLSLRSMSITNFSTKNGILTINRFPYSPELAPRDFYLFEKLHLVIKGKRHADIEDIQRSTTAILNIISTDEIKMSFISLLDRAKRCIESEGDCFE